MKTLLLVLLLSFILGSLTVPTSCSDQGATTLELNEAFEAENTLGLDVEKTVEKLTRCQGTNLTITRFFLTFFKKVKFVK